MGQIRKRQVHLDFHTNPTLPVGNDFSKEQFQAALKDGHVNSITVFAKCHHGMHYHPTKVGKMHPTLTFDLLGAQLEACKEIDVKAPVYISAGLDEYTAELHPEWRHHGSPVKEDVERDFREGAHFHCLCFNTDYLDLLCAEIEEVMELYDPCGIFLDIVGPRVCYCDSCRAGMKAEGLDIENPADREYYAEKVYLKYAAATNAAVRKHSSTATIFHNMGHVPKGNYDIINTNTHLELESLPTGGWGYDHFPLSAAYVRTVKGKEFLGMTGKFHNTWGEFGGFKHPNALIYETALSVANGGGCSIGDQMHPLSALNPATYHLIGKAYGLIEQKEPWLNDAVNLTDVAVLSAEAVTGSRSKGEKSDVGANRMLLECKTLYDFIDAEADFSSYKLIVLPDTGELTDEVIRKLQAYTEKGGKVIAAGGAAVKNGEFILDFGARFEGKSEFSPTYFLPCFDTVDGTTEYLMKGENYRFTPLKGKVIGEGQNPYFNRTREHFCSHQHAPNNPEEIFPAVVVNNGCAYIGWNIFTGYATEGHLSYKEIFRHVLDTLLGDDRLVKVDLPDRGVVTLTEQKQENRNILHLLFAHTCLRGARTEVIEDAVPLYNVACTVKCETAPKAVTLEPEGQALPFTYADGKVSFTVPKVLLHQMVCIQK